MSVTKLILLYKYTNKYAVWFFSCYISNDYFSRVDNYEKSWNLRYRGIIFANTFQLRTLNLKNYELSL